jgi:sigma-B regulation protein RsbU (phosphoserine phosphatase)
MRIVPRRHITAGSMELFGESVPVGNVGGDYFGAWQPDAQSLHVCIADVSGKGTPGAMIAAMLHASVSTLAMSGGRVEKIVNEIEAILRDQIGEGHYLTLFYGVLDVNTGSLDYVNAGHCPPLLRRSDGRIETLQPTRPVLGLIRNVSGDVGHTRLRPGERLVMYTDGISEAAAADGREFGADGLTAMLDNREDLPSWHASVLKAVHEHGNGKLTDDATMVLIAMRDAAAGTHASQGQRAAFAPTEP